MSLRRLAVLSGIVVVLLAFILLYERNVPTTQQRLEKGNTAWDIDPSALARFQILRGSETLEFARKKDQTWKMVKPVPYPADAEMMSSLVSDLAHPEKTGDEAESTSQPDYGLMAPRAVVTVTTKPAKGGESASYTVSIGKDVPGTDTVAARVKGENRIVFLRSTLAADLLKPVDAYKSHKVFDASPDDVTQISIVRGRGRIEFEKRKGEWWLTSPIVDLGDPTAVTRLVGSLLGETVSEFVPIAPSELAGDGLNPPIYTVRVVAAGKPTVLSVGATRSDGKTVYAQANGQTFALDSSVTDDLSSEADSYRDRKLARFDAADVRAITISSPERNLKLSKSGEKWTADGHDVPSAAVSDFLTALAAFQSKGFLSANETAAAASAPETLGVKLEFGDRPALDISFRSVKGGSAAARVTGRPAALAVGTPDLEGLVSQLGKLTPPRTAPKAASGKK
jgi:hypothetical protein